MQRNNYSTTCFYILRVMYVRVEIYLNLGLSSGAWYCLLYAVLSTDTSFQ